MIIIWNGSSIDEISLATQFIEGTLSKDTTFSNRTELWANAVYKIKQNPWIGFGVQNVEWNDEYLGGSGPHNFLLLLLLQGGQLLCFSFIAIVLYAIKHALQTPTKTTSIGIMGLGALFIMSLFEAYNIIQVFLLVQFVLILLINLFHILGTMPLGDFFLQYNLFCHILLNPQKV